MPVRLAVGLGITAVMFAIAGRRFFWLYRLISSGQPAVPNRFRDVPKRVEAELTEVGGQRKLLKWTVPGLAHAFTFWGFTVLLLTILEAYGCLFQRDFHIPLIGHTAVIGFVEDFFAVAVLVSLGVFVGIRVKHSPKRENRRSRFFGSHTGAAWLVLLMISGVIITLLLYRAAQVNTGNFPYGWWAFASHIVARALAPLGTGVNSVIETVALLANIAIITGFLVFVSYSKHLHIFLAPINVDTSRRPRALGALASTPDMSMEDVGEDIRWCSAPGASRTSRGSNSSTSLPAPNVDGASRNARHGTRKAAFTQALDHGPPRQPFRLGRQGDGRTNGLPGSKSKPWCRTSSTLTSCGRALPVGPVWSNARWTSSTSTPSSTCVVTRS